MSVLCPGASIGCTVQSKREQVEVHAESCIFAKLAPVLAAQAEKIGSQEAAQRQMSRKLEVLENGFFSMQSILYPRLDDPDRSSADSTSIPMLYRTSSEGEEAVFTPQPDLTTWRDDRTYRRRNDSTTSMPGDHIFTTDFDLASPFPPPAADSPYASPLHHLLSMHEALREEMSRLSTSLQELEGRTQMQSLNENLRTREEITYVGAQVAGLARQVHWLTSAQLQRQGGTGRSGTPGAEGSVGEAISSAVRGAARIVGASTNAAAPAGSTAAAGSSNGMVMRRGPSEEGRTKL
ncbi:unnamed protein product [Zymoseptoria tritici ST99CH_1A5]|uniref:Uncharacterized protein n=1 Tax=Zymoseptoria tritici ST99CH_1A5 TaxID=1276529 RepID=A0A1Y6LYW9_ZYMTR|nr:unnamed protein product [Zymoseptoria tritici ST99CH_1A5]